MTHRGLSVRETCSLSVASATDGAGSHPEDDVSHRCRLVRGRFRAALAQVGRWGTKKSLAGRMPESVGPGFSQTPVLPGRAAYRIEAMCDRNALRRVRPVSAQIGL